MTKIMLENRSYPSVIKYMGSKKKILDFVIKGINQVHKDGEAVCDLFAGSSSLAGSLNNQVEMIVNDIQVYSKVIAELYLHKNKSKTTVNIDDIINSVENKVQIFMKNHPEYNFNYSKGMELDTFNELEASQRELLNHTFNEKYHLFAKDYSGTYWSYKQCIYIDALREEADSFKGTFTHYLILASTMFAMAYTSQSTGHYAQYRDANTESSKNDILNYRLKDFTSLVRRKYIELSTTLNDNSYNYTLYNENYLECLDKLPINTTVYADPPYCFVHYSRFYHALETFIKYDYPEIMFKGRYRTDRHQSPFCIKTKVEEAFRTMFEKIRNKNSSLVLSYSNTGMISLDRLEEIAEEVFCTQYQISELEVMDYQHSTMGRKGDKHRDVEEILLLIKREG